MKTLDPNPDLQVLRQSLLPNKMQIAAQDFLIQELLFARYTFLSKAWYSSLCCFLPLPWPVWGHVDALVNQKMIKVHTVWLLCVRLRLHRSERPPVE